MRRRQFLISAGAGLGAAACSDRVLARLAGEDEDAFNRRMAWWREARFGMFVHWGVSSVAAGRWNARPARPTRFTSTSSTGPPQLSIKLNEPVLRAYLLSDPSHPGLTFRQPGDTLTLRLPASRPEPNVSVAALVI